VQAVDRCERPERPRLDVLRIYPPRHARDDSTRSPVETVNCARAYDRGDLHDRRLDLRARLERIPGRAVKQRVHVITLAVDDLERSLAFYRDGLGFSSTGVIGTEWKDERTGANGAIALFELDGGLILSLYPRSDLARDAEIRGGAAQSGEFSLGQLVERRDEVDELLARAEAAGAEVTRAHERPWGIYSGYFRDPDGHLWEVIWNPGRIPS
jgi:catechol 2,3-dioxygenase-like lactoylglutathione lyase family enzyme